MIDKDIENIRSFIRSIRTDLEEYAPDNFKLAKSIENVLSEFQGLRDFSTETVRRNAELQEELETYKKIAENLAGKLEDIILTLYENKRRIVIETEVVKEYLNENKSIKAELIEEAREEVEK